MGLTGRDRDGRAPPRRALLIAVLLAAPPVAGPAQGGEPALLALWGFDPVTFVLPGGPFPGSERFELAWGGRVWRFASGSNRAAFRDDPEIYAPRLGGFDAVGVLDRRLVDADPAVFARIDGRLYLFRDAERRARFVAEPGLARTAEAIWPTLRGLTDGP